MLQVWLVYMTYFYNQPSTTLCEVYKVKKRLQKFEKNNYE